MIKVEFPFNFLCLNLKERQIFSLEIIEQTFLIILFLGFFFIIFFILNIPLSHYVKIQELTLP